MKTRLSLIVAICLFGIAGCDGAKPAEEPQVATEVAVKVGQTIKTTLHRYVSAYGMVEPAPAMQGKAAASSKIATPIGGLLAQVFCVEGQSVKKGDLLFQLDTRNSDALIAKAEVAVDFAQKNFARKQALAATDNVSRKLYDEAQQLLQNARKDLLNMQTQRELLQIRAPLSGTLSAINFKVGEVVNPNTVLADLTDLQRLSITLKLPSPEADSIQLNQTVQSNTAAASQAQAQPFSGRVTFVGSQIDPLTDTVVVRVSVAADSGLRPGQFVTARILVEERPDRLAVPIASVVNSMDSSVIAVVEGDHARQVAVKPGLRDGNLIEIAAEDLHEGMTVVSSGAYGLPPKTRIRVLK
ncbi:MAG: efflux RND transporter periplasmic adaptor subunit [Methylomonas sp.]|jgi:membrane fusion protein (multidrug efflux system)|uniref:efflux RND transporter periplasmic adaptor subunit n=1 Tax=Methylomonas sp. TaxID=418 RepID=UPI0025EE0E01|nr:efflux RND transporter periplasmic adaptor subunit [Methylomonas sp.]MCK9607468.1 efflux RND transporter periplasmic adaptor subunit [Methylomonas sp.]